MKNAVFFWAKKMMERWYLLITEKSLFWTFRWWEIWPFFESRSWWKRWYLLITEKFLFWTFRWWEIRSFFESRSDGKMIFTSYREVIVLNFSLMGNRIFFSAKKLMERWYLFRLFELSMIFQDLGNTVFRVVYEEY